MTAHAQQHHCVRPVRAILLTIGSIVCGALLLLWSWNILATDLFDLPAVQFKHALALELCFLAIYGTHRLALNMLSIHHRHARKRYTL